MQQVSVKVVQVHTPISPATLALGDQKEFELNENELKEIYSMLEEVIFSSTKEEAKSMLKKLEFKRVAIGSEYGGNASYKLGEAIDSARSASGRVPDKEHHRLRAEMRWSTFKSILSRSEATIKR